MVTQTFIVLLCFLLVSILSQHTPSGKKNLNSRETIVDLNIVSNGPRIFEPRHIHLTARDLDEPDTLQEHTYFLIHDHVRYTCTAAFASLCPQIYGGAWTITNHKLGRFANTTIIVDGFTLTRGSLEYSCFTILRRFCPTLPGGVWKLTRNVKEEKTPNKGRFRVHEPPTVICFAQDVQFCRDIKTGNEVIWIFKQYQNWDPPGQWMKKINNAELFCNAPKVEICPFNDGEWLRVPTIMKLEHSRDFERQKSVNPRGSGRLHDAPRDKEKKEITKKNEHQNMKSIEDEGETDDGNSKENESSQTSRSNSFESEGFEEESDAQKTAKLGSSNQEDEFGYVKHINPVAVDWSNGNQTLEIVEEGWGKFTYKDQTDSPRRRIKERKEPSRNKDAIRIVSDQEHTEVLAHSQGSEDEESSDTK